MKIELNKCYGGFGVSKEACQYMADRGHQGAIEHLQQYQNEDEWIEFYNVKRDDPLLVEAVQTLGDKASASFARLVIVDFDVNQLISEYDGNESLAISHRLKYTDD